MIIFLYGEDSWRRGERKKFIIQEFLKKNPSWGLSVFDLEKEGGIIALRDFLAQTSLFAGKKLAVVENADLKENKKFLLSQVKSEHSLLLSTDSKPTKEVKFLLEDPVIREDFPAFKGAEWASFLNKKAKALGLSFEPSSLRLFASIYEKNTWAAMTELERLSFLGKKEINLKDMSALDLEADPDFWLTLRKLTGNLLQDRLRALQSLNLQNEPAGKTFNIISSFWPSKNPQFADYDQKVKSGKLEYEEALLDAVLS